MKIKKLKIEGYKNLNVNLELQSEAIVLIGNNGSGKSNLLEALSIIFKNLYLQENSTPFNYSMEYLTSNNNKVEISKTNALISFKVNDEEQISIKDYLPKKVIAIYSGEEDRLWSDCYKPVYFNFIRDINKTAREGIMSYNQMPQMLFLNKFYWNISLLTLLLSDLDSNKAFVKDVLKIKKVNKIKFDFNRANYSNYSNSLALGFVKKIDAKSEYTLTELKGLLADDYTSNDIFSFLYLVFTPDGKKIIEDIQIKFNDVLSVKSLSEGEKKLLLLKASFEFAVQEDSLFILDEPDAHIHINNKERITKLIEPYKKSRQIVITTHSPTITKSIDNNELFMMDDGEIIKKEEQEILDHLTSEFWNKHQQSSFLSSDKKMILLVEGEHDKIHINNAFKHLSDEYSNLNFDIFYMNSANNIPPMMTGLRTCEIDYDKVFVGLFDDDETGNTELSKTTCLYPNNQNSKRHKLGFYAFKYPKHSNHKSKIFTVESFFESSKYEECYKEAVANQNFEGLSINSLSDKIKEKSKTLLAKKSQEFVKEDFKNFRALFEILNKIFEENKPKNIIIFNEAKGVYNEEETSVLLLNGSKIKKDYTPSTKQEYKDQRDNLLKTIKHKIEDDKIIIQQDYKFETPSGAAKFVNGGNRNGWTCWKDENGISLKQKYKTE